ncbi:MAG: peptidase domain-containing ABC transporter [Prevotellaceae bacterium]|jgi:ATP-binding cassette subfamily B protein|nr:peptidase domain-containing ABC transporter [Prevotellaceae bacterium]
MFFRASTLKHQARTTFTRQHDQSDCGMACLLSLLRYYGGNSSFERIRELSGTDRQGTSLLGLYQAANVLGFKAEGCEADMESLKKHGNPVILHILDEQSTQHFVICYEYANGYFLIGNPAKGIELWTPEQVLKHWVSKVCLTLKPSANFERKDDVNKQKKQWIKNLIQEDIKRLLASILLGLVLAGLGVIMAVFSQKLIDNILPSKDASKLIVALILLFVIMLIQIGLSVVRQRMLIQQSKDFNNRIVGSFYSKLMFLPKSFFDNRKVGDLTARLNDTRRIQSFIILIIGSAIISLLSVVVYLVVIFIYSWQLALPVLCSLPLYFFIIHRYNSSIIKKQREVMASYAQSESNFISTIQGVSTIKNFNKQHFFSMLNQHIYGIFQDRVYTLGKLNITIGWKSSVVNICFLIMLLSMGSFFVLDEQLTLGRFMAVLTIGSSLLPIIASLAIIAIPYNEAKVAFDRMFEFVSMEAEDTEEDVMDNSPPPLFESLEVKNLCFRFVGRKQLLSNINLKIRKGEIVSIAGESGCGKSTFCQILQKFYNIESGEIIINNNISLSQLSTENWRNMVGVVPQDIFIFNGTVLENICLENPVANAEQVVDFSKQYGFDSHIKELPQGYMTIIGEEGVNLSGGQKQILALARALFKNPQLLVLDEATAAMDRNTEQFVLNLLMKMKDKVTTLFVSHRLHILKTISDKIYLFDKGCIVGKGTHDELCRSNNMYSSYWKDIQKSLIE